MDGFTKLLLLNAIYYKGNWEDVFDAENTRPRTFHLNAGRSVQTEMMYNSQGYKIANLSSPDCRIIEIPYKVTAPFKVGKKKERLVLC